MNIVADENIPCVESLFGRFGTIRRVTGTQLRPYHVRTADALLVRSVTRVDGRLLDGSSVQFVGSATIGTDHVDVEYLRAENIAFAHAPGSNADSVADYVVAALLRLTIRRTNRLRDKTVGIVGVGNVGGRLAERLLHLGCTVLFNDPPRQEAGHWLQRGEFQPLSEVLRSADVVTLHVPLTRAGEHSTFHLIDGRRLKHLKPGAWLINTSRGAVVDNDALTGVLHSGRGPDAVVLDVWENEPEPSAELVRLVDLATPHVAGYAYDAKVRGASMIYQAFRKFLKGRENQSETEMRSHNADNHDADNHDADNKESADACPHASPTSIRIGAPDTRLPEQEWMDLFVRNMYDIEEDHASMQELVHSHGIDGAGFTRLRRDYGLRREFASHSVAVSMVPAERRRVLERALKVNLL